MTAFVDVVEKSPVGEDGKRFDITLSIQVEYSTKQLTLSDIPKTVADELNVGDRYNLVKQASRS